MKVLETELGEGIHIICTWDSCAKYLPGFGLKSQALIVSPNAYNNKEQKNNNPKMLFGTCLGSRSYG